MPIKKKLQPTIPPNHNYCPVCGDKAEFSSNIVPTVGCSEISIRKYCNKCGATWTVRYYLKPKAITNIAVATEYEDIPL